MTPEVKAVADAASKAASELNRAADVVRNLAFQSLSRDRGIAINAKRLLPLAKSHLAIARSRHAKAFDLYVTVARNFGVAHA